MTNTLTRIRTVLTAVVFWLGIAGAVIAIMLAELGPHIGNPVVATIVAWLLPAATIVATLAAIIRRVTEVIPAQRSLLPESYPIPAKRASDPLYTE